MRTVSLRSVVIAAAVVVGSVSMVACTTTKPDTTSAQNSNSTTLGTRVSSTLQRLYETAPGSKEMVQRARGVLVFPSVIGGSFVVGVEHGRGELLIGNRVRGEYTTTAASIGWQAGGQSKAVIYVFNTQEALDKFLKSDGWAVGADATVAAGKIGANGSVDSTSFDAPVSSYVLTNAGLEAGVALGGSKITRVTK
ncbi:MAG: twin-arginine translocation pathway signal [Proteobacteria bacterium]|nr:twin-arginine translocation pathway signal [Pseudomonadota bacterium]MBS0493107.1 twin-arginine translocation pathway signal [Pseudomonadota bacterium]